MEFKSINRNYICTTRKRLSHSSQSPLDSLVIAATLKTLLSAKHQNWNITEHE
jgi:hypothetical protein